MPELQPFVSICTPTFNRRPFLSMLAICIQNQTYPQDRMEWIIVDDGSDCVQDELNQIIPQMKCKVKYFYCSAHTPLGEKRNWLSAQCSGDILVNMDDDDYYPPTRVQHAVEQLNMHPECLIAGSDVMFIYYHQLTDNHMYQCGPHGSGNRATAATFAFRRELLAQTSYPSDAIFSEESGFLRGYTIPMIQLDPLQTILVFAHAHNSLDKTVLLEMQSEANLHQSARRVTDVMPPSTPQFDVLYTFYTNELHANVIPTYTAGDPQHKPWMTEAAGSAIERFGKKKIHAQAEQIHALQTQLAQKNILVQQLMEKLQKFRTHPQPQINKR